MKIVAPKVAGVKLKDGALCAAEGQLAGTPSVVFDAVALLVSVTAALVLDCAVERFSETLCERRRLPNCAT